MGLLEHCSMDYAPRPVYHKLLTRTDLMAIEDGGIVAAWRGNKAIAEGFMQPRPSLRVEIDVHPFAVVQGQDTQVIYAMDVIGMGVRIEHCLYAVHFGVEHLLAKIGAGVD